MCIHNFDMDRTINTLKRIKNKIYIKMITTFPCLQTTKRKNSDPVASFENPCFDPNFYELEEVVVHPPPPRRIIDVQPYIESSDDEIIFQKNNNHLIQINEIKRENEYFNHTYINPRIFSTSDDCLSEIPEDIDSSIERHSSPDIPYISSPLKTNEIDESNNLFFDDLEEEMLNSNQLSKSNLSAESVKINSDSEDNWDLIR